MSKSRKRKNLQGRNARGENWPQYLKEMQTLGPILNKMDNQQKRGIVDQYGKVVRSNGSHPGGSEVERMINKMDAKKASKNMGKIIEYQRAVINKYIEDELKQLLPKWAMRYCAKGKKWPLKLFGIKVEVAHGDDPYPLGHDVVGIRVWGSGHSLKKFDWEM